MTARAKHVKGLALYIDDIPEPPGLLHVYVAMSERAHARITRSRSERRSRTAPGVACVLTAEPTSPGINDASPVMGDDPVFAEGTWWNYVGQSASSRSLAGTIDEARRRRRPGQGDRV